MAVRCQLKLGNAFLCSNYRSGAAGSNYRLVTEPKNLEWHSIASKNNHETQRKKLMQPQKLSLYQNQRIIL